MARIAASVPDGSAEALPESLRRRYARAKAQRTGWEALWQDCYDYALPSRRGSVAIGTASGSQAATASPRSGEKLFDGTASDAADQLAAALLAQLTPPWSSFITLAETPAVCTARANVFRAGIAVPFQLSG